MNRGSVPHAANSPAPCGELDYAPAGVTDLAANEDASLSVVARLLRHATTRVPARIWLWLTLLSATHLLRFPHALSFIAAPLATLFFLSLVWEIDVYEEEPWRLVVRAFFWGALPAVVLAALAEVLIGAVVISLGGEIDVDSFTARFVGPIVEELCKGAGLVMLVRRHRNEFDGRLDGLL